MTVFFPVLPAAISAPCRRGGLLGLLLLGALLSGAQVFSGALPTDAALYERVGQAPLPMDSRIPARVDLGVHMPPAGNQATQNSCVAWALAYANYSYLHSRSTACPYEGEGFPNFGCLFSPAYIYNQINRGQDKGAYFTDAFRLLQTQGVAPLDLMPYDAANWWRKPSAAAQQAAAAHKINTYWQLGRNGEDLFLETKAYLARGLCIIASAQVDDYLRRQDSFPTPYVWTAWSGDKEPVGHAIVIVGYDDSTARFKFLNSYGQEWGNNGYGYISYALYQEAILEAFIMQAGGAVAAPMLQRDSKTLAAEDQAEGLFFAVDRVEHFQFPAGYRPSPTELFSKTMTFHGRVSIPAGLGKQAQVVVYFYLDHNGTRGTPVVSANPMTNTLKGQAVTGTPPIPLPAGEAFSSPFYAQMRYADFVIPKGYPLTIYHTNLIAEPVLLIDGFPVRIGQPHRFFVRI